MSRILIHNIKHIQNLEFELPGQGVHVLTGSNGSGKTTLMACLFRIGASWAFQEHFRTSRSPRLDLYGNGYIQYTLNNQSVKYQYSNVRWTPRPRPNNAILSQFGYPEVRFLPATGNRLYITDSEFDPSDVRPTEQWLKDDLNSLLETQKFNNLRFVQTGSTRGRGGGSQRWKRAYVIRTNPSVSPAKYYSERNFSLGEILVLNTLLLIQDVPNGSMLLIDELEMALHPRVQVKLLRYLEEKARQKNLTIILSTHSSSLIKCANNLIYLENPGNGNINVHRNIYATMVLQNVAIEEDIQPDYTFYVEDDMAELLLKRMILKYWDLYPNRLRPLYKVLPIGGFKEVLKFTKRSYRYLLPDRIGQYAFLDADVQEQYNEIDAKGNNRSESEQRAYELFNELSSRTKYLPITPELGVWEWISNNPTLAQNEINSFFHDAPINMTDLINDANQNVTPVPGKPRDEAKKRMNRIFENVESHTNRERKGIIDAFMAAFVKNYYQDQTNQNSLQAMFGPVFNSPGN